MTLKAYFDNIQAKTGKKPQEFVALAKERGLTRPGVKAGEIVEWLNKDYGPGRGHAMAIVLLLKQASAPQPKADERIGRLFSGTRSHWRKSYDRLLQKMQTFGPDVTVSPTDSYISVLRKGRKFSVLQVTSDRMDIGIKLKGAPTKGRFEKAGAWNAMVTHRVRVARPSQIDTEVISWLHRAYDNA